MVLLMVTILACGASAEICSSGQAGVSVYYINGINSDLAQSLESAVRFSRAAREFFDSFSSPANCLKRVGVSYNPTHGVIADLYESYLQLRGPQASQAEFDAWRTGLLTPEAQFLALVNELLEEAQNQVIGQVRDRFVGQYRSEMAAGNKVVAVGHSQGNFYANLVHSELYGGSQPIPTDSFGIVGVATPASAVAGSGRYTTLERDIILLVASLPANIGAGECSGEGALSLLCHNFVESYMGLEASRQKILEDLLAIADGLEIPPMVPTVMSDNFNDNSLNAGLWETETPSPGCTVNVAETNQRLEVTAFPTGVGSCGGGVVTRQALAGDFDVQVDVALLNWPPGNTYGARLVAPDLGVGSQGTLAVMRYSSPEPNEYYSLALLDHSDLLPTTDLSGTLRLVRIGSTLSGYYWNGSSWVLIGSGNVSTVATRIALELGTGETSAPSGVKIGFDNFKVNVGTVSSP
jgi:hypothetical protein